MSDPPKNPLDTDEEVPLGERFPYLDDPCPKCGKKTLLAGFGLACGPGIGTYWVCDSCDHNHKEPDEQES